jgi:hypothetical protein
VPPNRSQGDDSQGRAKAQPRQRRKPEAKAEPRHSQGASQSQSQSQDEEAAASSTASSAATSSFLGNPGAPFEPRASAPPGPDGAPGPGELPLPLELGWTPERAEYLLKGQGAVTHALVGVGDQDWKWQAAELDAVAPPLANTLNQAFDGRLVPFAQHADLVGALMGLAAYVERSRRERVMVLASRAPVEQPVTGAPAAVGSAADPDAARREAVLQTIPRAQPAQPGGDAAAEGIDWRRTDGA